MFFVILVTHPKSYIETTDRRVSAANCQTQRGGEDGCYREKFWIFFSVGGARSKRAFIALPFDYPAHSLQETVMFTPNQWYRWKAETLKVCLLLVCQSGESVTRHLANIGP